jgi:DNA-binding CsgD family transcriptional regulator
MQKRKLSLDQNIFAKELYRIRIGLFINLFSMIIPWLIVLHLYRAGQSQRAKQKQDEANQNMEVTSGSIIVSQSDGEARLSQMVNEVINHLNEGFESMKVEQINQSLLSTEESDAGMLKSIPLNEITDLNGLDRKEIILVPIEFQNNLSQMGLSLTVREIRLLYYIYLGFTNSDLEKILAISDLAVRKAKNRVKKKIGIPKETKLDAWVRNILFPITRT